MAQAGASLGWDLDFWGRQADAVHRAQDLAQSASFDEDNARLMLAGAMAQAYIELYRENALADIAQRSELQRQKSSTSHGAEWLRGSTRSSRSAKRKDSCRRRGWRARRRRRPREIAVHRARNADRPGRRRVRHDPASGAASQAALPVPEELPINLLARRPDVLSARSLVQAADAERLASKAAFYPDVSLRALAGIGAFGMSNLVKWNARGYGAGPLISLPLFDGGRLRGAVSRQRG